MSQVCEGESEAIAASNPPPRLTVLARQLLIVMLGSASLILAIASSVSDEPKLFIGSTQMEQPARMMALGLCWGGGVLVALVTLVLSLLSANPDRVRSLVSLACAPLIVSAFVPPLFARQLWTNAETEFLALVLAVGLALERLLRPGVVKLAEWWEDSPLARHWQRYSRALKFVGLVLVLGLVAGYIYRIGILTNISHVRLQTSSSDLAEYDNLFFNALNGHPFRSPAIAGHLDDWNTLQGHAEFSLYMLLPFYAISPGAHALLWIQTVIVAATAIPIYLLGAARLGRFAGVCFAAVYLIMPAVQRPNFYDFHFTPLGMFYVAWLMFFAARLAADPGKRRYRIAMYCSLGLALLCREDTSIGIAVVGAYFVLSGVLAKDGLVLAGAASCYFVAMKFGIMPLFGRWWFDAMYEDLKAEGAKGFGAVVLTLISNPSFVLRSMLTEPKLLYVLHMSVPMLALWLRKPLLWMAILPGFVSTLLVTNRPPMYEASFQYTYLWIPYVVAASIVATRKGRAGVSTLLSLVLGVAALSNQLSVFPYGDSIKGGFSNKTFELTDAARKRYVKLRKIIAMIPPDAVVTASESEGPHVSTRLIMYSLKYTLGPDPDYILVGRVGIPSEKIHLRQALESGKYGVVAQEGIFVLAKRGASTETNRVLWSKIELRPPAHPPHHPVLPRPRK